MRGEGEQLTWDLTWNSSELDTSIWACSHWSRKCPPWYHTASWPWALLRSTLSSPLSESRGQGWSGFWKMPLCLT